MKKITQVDRVLKILEMLSEGKRVSLEKNPNSGEITLLEDMKKYNYQFEGIKVGLRTLQKDMVYIKEYLGDNLEKNGSSYSLLKKESLDDFFKDNHQEIRKFFHAISLIDRSLFGERFQKYDYILDTLKEQQKGIYLFLENPFEELKELELQERLEQYIQAKRYIDIRYHSDQEYKFRRVQPYKIIYHSGNWYLAVLTTEDYEVNGGFRLLRLNFISKISPCQYPPTNFHENSDVKEFLENKFQSLFSSYNREFFKVKVHISKSVERYFKVKRHLKSQKIIEQRDDGVIVEFNINDEMEIIPLVQTWLPHIRIIEPLSLHEKVLKNIQGYNALGGGMPS